MSNHGGLQNMSLSRDEVYEVLSSHRRRFVIHYLRQNGEQADLGSISEHVAAWENETDVNAITSSQRKNVYTSLQQFHLPKMADKGVVDYDDRAGVVELAESAEDIDVYLEVISGNEVPWSIYYAGLGTVGIGLLAGDAMGMPLLSEVPSQGWAVFLATAIFVSAIVHTWCTRRMRLGNDGTPPEVDT